MIKTFGTYLKELRESNNISLEDLSKQLDIYDESSKCSILKSIEASERSVEEELLHKIATIFNIDIKEVEDKYLKQNIIRYTEQDGNFHFIALRENYIIKVDGNKEGVKIRIDDIDFKRNSSFRLDVRNTKDVTAEVYDFDEKWSILSKGFSKEDVYYIFKFINNKIALPKNLKLIYDIDDEKGLFNLINFLEDALYKFPQIESIELLGSYEEDWDNRFLIVKKDKRPPFLNVTILTLRQYSPAFVEDFVGLEEYIDNYDDKKYTLLFLQGCREKLKNILAKNKHLKKVTTFFLDQEIVETYSDVEFHDLTSLKDISIPLLKYKNFYLKESLNKKIIKIEEEFKDVDFPNKHEIFKYFITKNELAHTPSKETLFKLMKSASKQISGLAIDYFDKNYHQDFKLNNTSIWISGGTEIYKATAISELLKKTKSSFTKKRSKDTQLLVLGHKHKVDELPTDIPIITIRQLDIALNQKEDRTLAKSDNDNISQKLIDFLLSEDVANVNMALKLMDKGGIPNDVQSLLFGVFKVHPDKKVRSTSSKLIKKHGGSIGKQLMDICGRRNYLSMESDMKPKKDIDQMLEIEGFDVVPFCYFIASRHNIGTYALTGLDSDWTERLIMEKYNNEKVSISGAASPRFIKATKIKDFTVSTLTPVLWEMKLDKLDIITSKPIKLDTNGTIKRLSINSISEITISGALDLDELKLSSNNITFIKKSKQKIKKLSLSGSFTGSFIINDIQPFLNKHLQELIINAKKVSISGLKEYPALEKLKLSALEVIIDDIKGNALKEFFLDCKKLKFKQKGLQFEQLEKLNIINCEVKSFEPYYSEKLKHFVFDGSTSFAEDIIFDGVEKVSFKDEDKNRIIPDFVLTPKLKELHFRYWTNYYYIPVEETPNLESLALEITHLNYPLNIKNLKVANLDDIKPEMLPNVTLFDSHNHNLSYGKVKINYLNKLKEFKKIKTLLFFAKEEDFPALEILKDINIETLWYYGGDSGYGSFWYNRLKTPKRPKFPQLNKVPKKIIFEDLEIINNNINYKGLEELVLINTIIDDFSLFKNPNLKQITFVNSPTKVDKKSLEKILPNVEIIVTDSYEKRKFKIN